MRRDADPEGDGRKNADEYALACDPREADEPKLAFTWSMDGAVRRPALKFRRPANTLDLGYQLQASGSLGTWPVITSTTVSSTPLAGDTEEVIFRDTASDTATARFLRLSYLYQP